MVLIGDTVITGISGGIQGTGSIPAGHNGTVTWSLQALNLTSAISQILSFGGYISYTADGEMTRLPFYDISVVVYPSILIHVDYFIPPTFRGYSPLFLTYLYPLVMTP